MNEWGIAAQGKVTDTCNFFARRRRPRPLSPAGPPSARSSLARRLARSLRPRRATGVGVGRASSSASARLEPRERREEGRARTGWAATAAAQEVAAVAASVAGHSNPGLGPRATEAPMEGEGPLRAPRSHP